MIKSLRLRNFKTHEDSLLVFDPTVNCIWGDSGSGKSNIMRAEKWVRTNRPLNSRMIKRGCDSVEVELVIQTDTSEHVIKRIRSKGKNIYVLDGEEFTAGTNVPASVADAIGISDASVQLQLQPHFLVFDSPGAVAKHIRDITGISILDKLISSIAGKLKKASMKKTSVDDELESVEAKINAIDVLSLNRANTFVRRIEESNESIDVFRHEISKISELIKQLEDVNGLIVDIPVTDEDIQKTRETIELVEELGKEHTELLGLISEHDGLKQISLPANLDDAISNGRKIVSALEKKQRDVDALRDEILSWEQIERKTSDLDEVLESLRDEHTECLKNMTTCPSCGSELNDKSKMTLIERL